MKPLVVVDFRVFVYNILHEFKTIAYYRDLETQENWLKAAWAIYLNRGCTTLPYVDHTVVVVNDSPPYWRNEYLKNRGFPEYKGGRPDKPELWYQVEKAGLDYIFSKNSPYFYLEKEGFEADDFAGAIVRLQPKRTIFLHTIDTDWLGLVKQTNFDTESLLTEEQSSTQVLWNNLVQWQPRLRGYQEAIEYVRKRLKTEISEPREIWDVKVEKGDKPDNLKRNSPLEVIDLEKPPKEYDLLNLRTVRPKIEGIVNSSVTNSNKEHLIKSKKWFEKNGFFIPMLDFNLYQSSLNTFRYRENRDN